MMPTVAMAETPTPTFGEGWTALTVNDGAISTKIAAGGKYYLSEDLTISSTFVVSVGTADNPVTLDLNGHVLKYENDSTKGSVIIVESDANLILNDSGPSAAHEEETGLSSKGGVITGGTGTVWDPDDSTTYGGGVLINLGGKFTMNAGSIENCTASCGGGVCNFSSAEFTMNGGSIVNCKRDNKGGKGGSVLNLGTFTMSGGKINKCESIKEVYRADINLAGNMYANGGEIQGTVYIDYEGYPGKIDSTVNAEKQTRFYCGVESCGEIAAGIFEGTVRNGFYYDGSIPYYGKISGGTFEGTVENNAYEINGKLDKSEITGGKFLSTVTNAKNAIVSGGDFSAATTLDGEGKIGTVRFDLNGGSGDAPVTQWRYNCTATEPETTPARGGYNFDGWYNGNEKWDFSTEVTSDLTLTAKFTPVKMSSGSHKSYVQKPTVSLGTDAKVEKAADGSTVYTTAEGSIVISKDGRTASITPADGYEVANVSVNGKDMGAVTTLTGLRTGDEIIVSFQKTEEAKKAEAKAAAAKLSPIARSIKTAKGNIKVTVKFDKETESFIKEMQELGYTVKYKFYRSTKKSSGYKAMLTKSGRSYTNTNGKAGTKYYYKARVQIYDKDGKLIAQTALKQCQYASRTWTK